MAQHVGLAQQALGGAGEGGVQSRQGLVAAGVVAFAALGLVELLEVAGGGALHGGGEFQQLLPAAVGCGGDFDARGNKGVGDGVLLDLGAALAVRLGGAGPGAVDGPAAGAGGAQRGAALGAAGRLRRRFDSSRVDSVGGLDSARVETLIHDQESSRTPGRRRTRHPPA
uniref:hypothetical protein n=1 Tax=Kitasatospora indigofera TaxID=67307 RepID=UPI002F91A1AD